MSIKKRNGSNRYEKGKRSRCLHFEGNERLRSTNPSSILKSSFRPSQNFADTPKYYDNLRAVSAVTVLFPFIMAEILV